MATPRESEPVLPLDLSPAGLKTRIDQEARERRALMLLKKSRPKNLPDNQIELLDLGENEKILMGIAQPPASAVEVTRITPKGLTPEHYETPEQYVTHLSTSKRWALAETLSGIAILAADTGIVLNHWINHMNEVTRNAAEVSANAMFRLPNPFDLMNPDLTPEQWAAAGAVLVLGAAATVVGFDNYSKNGKILTRFHRVLALRS